MPEKQVRRSLFSRGGKKSGRPIIVEDEDEGPITYKNLNKIVKQEINDIIK